MTLQTTSSARARYGFDAPGIMLGLLLGGGAVVLTGRVIAALGSGGWRSVDQDAGRYGI